MRYQVIGISISREHAIPRTLFDSLPIGKLKNALTFTSNYHIFNLPVCFIINYRMMLVVIVWVEI